MPDIGHAVTVNAALVSTPRGVTDWGTPGHSRGVYVRDQEHAETVLHSERGSYRAREHE